MNKLKEGDVPQKRALTVDEIISKYPMSVRILLVQLVAQVERLQKKKPKVTEEWIEEKTKELHHELFGEMFDELYTCGGDFLVIKDFIRSLIKEVVGN